MNITSLEMTQATLEIVGGLICLLAYAIITINGHHTKSMKIFKNLFFMTSIIFITESLAYIFRGNTDLLSVFIAQTANFVVFVINFILTSLMIRYVYSFMEEKGVLLNPIYKRIVDIFTMIAIGIVVVSLFTHWMYYFDEMNYYHRNTGWYVYTTLSVVAPILVISIVIKNRKSISIAMAFSTIFYVLVPFIAIIIQFFIYGIAIVNLGIGISTFIMLFVYLNEWGKSQIVDIKIKEMRTKTYQSLFLYLIMVLIMSASIGSCFYSIYTIMDKNIVTNNENISNTICDYVDSEFLRPRTVTETMSKDYNLNKLLSKGKKNPKSVEKEIAAYLKSIQDGFGYEMVYVISSDNNAYYTSKGIVKYIDVDNDEDDIWYKDFVDLNVPLDLNVDTDDVNDWDLSIFNNARIEDEEGNLLGVCGVGIDMEDAAKVIQGHEDTYNVEISFFDESRFVQLTNNEEDILNKKVEVPFIKNVGNKSFYTDENAMYKYMDSLGWYIQVKFPESQTSTTVKIILPSLVIFVIGIIMMGVGFTVISARERRAYFEMLEKRKASLTDELTNLKNRRAYDQNVEMITEEMRDDLVVIVLDINGLKQVNDTIGHTAGDELIVGTANCLYTTLMEFGNVYRVGGDEFVALLHCTHEQLEDSLKTLDHVVGNWKGVLVHELSVSKGVVEYRDHKDLSYQDIIHLADQRMYEDKRAYYSNRNKDRRQ